MKKAARRDNNVNRTIIKWIEEHHHLSYGREEELQVERATRKSGFKIE